MLRHLKKPVKLLSEVILKRVEDFLVKKHVDIKYPPIFIIGPPRSGSTLLYQLVVRHFKVCYFSNLMMRFPMTPVCLAKVVAPLDGCHAPHCFISKYGKTPGWKGPNQGRDFWNYWLPEKPNYIDVSSLSVEVNQRIRSTIAIIQDIFEAPFLNKWQINTVRILPLSAIFPEALFIRIKRRPQFIVRSILQGRRIYCGNESRWFSTKPRQYEQLRHSNPLEQVRSQIHFLEEGIDHDIEIVGKSKFMTVHYEELVESPHMIMDNIKADSNALCGDITQ